MLVSSFNLSQSFNYTPYLFYKKRFKSEINSFCIWTLVSTSCKGVHSFCLPPPPYRVPVNPEINGSIISAITLMRSVKFRWV